MKDDNRCSFRLLSVTGYGFQEEGYSDADQNLEMEFEECFSDVVEWLDENIKGRYKFDDEYFHIDHYTVQCTRMVCFSNDADAVAFKVTWPEYEVA